MTRPSSQRASAIFSLVASAWKSTRIDPRLPPGLVDERVDLLERCSRRRSEEELAHDVDHRDRRRRRATGATARPRPGVADAKFAGRITRSERSR